MVRLAVDATWEDTTKKGVTCSCLLGQTSPIFSESPVWREERDGLVLQQRLTPPCLADYPSQFWKHPFLHPFLLLSPCGEPGVGGGSCDRMLSKCQTSTDGYGYYTLNFAEPCRHPCQMGYKWQCTLFSCCDQIPDKRQLKSYFCLQLKKRLNPSQQGRPGWSRVCCQKANKCVGSKAGP